jgi:hypothetical protein
VSFTVDSARGHHHGDNKGHNMGDHNGDHQARR